MVKTDFTPMMVHDLQCLIGDCVVLPLWSPRPCSIGATCATPPYTTNPTWAWADCVDPASRGSCSETMRYMCPSFLSSVAWLFDTCEGLIEDSYETDP